MLVFEADALAAQDEQPFRLFSGERDGDSFQHVVDPDQVLDPAEAAVGQSALEAQLLVSLNAARRLGIANDFGCLGTLKTFLEELGGGPADQLRLHPTS